MNGAEVSVVTGAAGGLQSTVDCVRSAEWMVAKVVTALEQGSERLFPRDRTSLSAYLYKLYPRLFMKQTVKRFHVELNVVRGAGCDLGVSCHTSGPYDNRQPSAGDLRELRWYPGLSSGGRVRRYARSCGLIEGWRCRWFRSAWPAFCLRSLLR